MMSEDKKEYGEEQYFVSHPKGNILAGIMVFFGFSLTSVLSVIFIGVFLLYVVLDGIALLFIPMFVLIALILLLMFMGVKGQTTRARIKRFKLYQRILENRELFSVEELAENIGQSYEYVLNDLKKMIELGWFIQGHIDTEEKNLFVTDKMYEQYTLAIANLRVPLKKEIENEVIEEEAEQ